MSFQSNSGLFAWLEGKQSQIEAFIHLGACSSTVETDASYLLENNYRFSVRLAEYALENNHRFIYASSAATYGDGSLGFSDDESRLNALHPLNMYGYSKHLFDLWLKNEKALDKVVGLKYFNVFGPNEMHKKRMASAITHILPTAQNEGVVRLFKSSEPDRFKDGEQKRDFIYVKDAARMTCAFLENDAAGIFNIAFRRSRQLEYGRQRCLQSAQKAGQYSIYRYASRFDRQISKLYVRRHDKNTDGFREKCGLHAFGRGCRRLCQQLSLGR